MMRSADETFRGYCRIAAVVFALNTIYPLVTKIAGDRLAGDWLHTVLHFVSALVAAYAGWGVARPEIARLYTWGIALGYGFLGVVGWAIPGLFIGTPAAIPLGPADNVFHLLLAAGAAAAIVLAARRRPQRQAA